MNFKNFMLASLFATLTITTSNAMNENQEKIREKIQNTNHLSPNEKKIMIIDSYLVDAHKNKNSYVPFQKICGIIGIDYDSKKLTKDREYLVKIKQTITPNLEKLEKNECGISLAHSFALYAKVLRDQTPFAKQIEQETQNLKFNIGCFIKNDGRTNIGYWQNKGYEFSWCGNGFQCTGTPK